MANLFTQTPINGSKPKQKSFIGLLASMLCLLSFTKATAQDVLAGITSTGGKEGRGTVFSIKTNGTGFSVVEGFADWGKTPNGDLYKDSNGSFYGMTNLGGTYTQGTIFKMTPAGVVTILRHLNSVTDGGNPHGELIKGTDGNFYGLTSAGGANTYGTIFKMSPDGSTFTVLRHFSYASDGTNPRGHLVQAGDGNFYGITTAGGANGVGTIFKITPSGTFSVLRHLNKTTDGGSSYGSLTLGNDGNLYGITNSGGTYNYGTIFKITTAGTYTVLKHLNGPTDGGYSQTDLIQGKDGNFYGTCYSYGTYGNGTIFKITTAGVYTVLRHLSSGNDGGYPYGGLYQNTDGVLYGLNRTGGSGGSGTAYKITTAGAYTVLHSFTGATEGNTPNGSFVKGNDGNLYAMLSAGGSHGAGTAIKMTTAGAVTTLVNFNGAAQGNAPMESLVKGRDSAYYGTASSGGAYGYGTIFKICGGTTTVLKSFNKSVDGGIPLGSLIQATDGNFYGMTSEGGTNGGYGTIFKITPAGVYTVIRHLTSSTDGGSPNGSLIQATDGFLYGMARNGGTNAGGTIFKISTTGASFTVLRHLAYATDGSNPEGDLVQGSDGNFYGMTTTNGKIFKITPTGTFTVLRTFVTSTDGSTPFGSLVKGNDGKFYGMTTSGGTYGYGTIFSITTTGTFKAIKHFNPTPDGKIPKGNLLTGKDGNFYGMTSAGGANNVGTIFKVTPAGTYTILRHLTMATDGGNPFGGLIYAPVNNLVANTQSLTTKEDTKLALTLSGSGGSPLTYKITTNPKKGKLSGTGANRTYTPNANAVGKDSFYFSVNVGCMASLPAIVRITITGVADTPVLAAIGNKSIVKNSTLTFTATATDADANTKFTYSLIGAPAGASINATSGAFTWTPATAGSYGFKVRVTDNSALKLYDEESITVTVTNTFAITATDEEKASSKIDAAIYPNPVHDRCYITLSTPAEEITVRIVDVNGKVLSTNNYHASGKNRIEIDAAQLSRGIYFAQLQTTEGSVSLRFIKQ